MHIFWIAASMLIVGCPENSEQSRPQLDDDDSVGDDDDTGMGDDDDTSSGEPGIPTIVDPAAEVTEVGPGGIKPSLAVDGAGRAHAVLLTTEVSHEWILYDQGPDHSWSRLDFSLADHWSPAGTCNNPHLEIDPATDRAWISGVMVVIGDYEGCGMAVLTRSSMSDAPTSPVFERRQMVSPPGWATGNLSLDVGNDSAILWVNMGAWERLTWDGAIVAADSGSALFTTNLGERPTGAFRVSRGEPVAHGDQGSRHVWHVAFPGHPNLGDLRWGGYQNSVREAHGDPSVTWSDSATYTGNEEDNFMGLAADRREPQGAYFAIDGHDGALHVNIWDGEEMLYPADGLLTCAGTTGYTHRWGPQLAAAPQGGAWLTWTEGGVVKLRFLALDGVHGDTHDITDGDTPTVATDEAGDVHLLYMVGGQAVHRRVEVERG